MSSGLSAVQPQSTRPQATTLQRTFMAALEGNEVGASYTPRRRFIGGDAGTPIARPDGDGRRSEGGGSLAQRRREQRRSARAAALDLVAAHRARAAHERARLRGVLRDAAPALVEAA